MKLVFFTFFCLLLCVLYYNFFVKKAYVKIEIEVSQKTDFKIYWAGTGQLYSEKKMAVVRVTPDHKHYSFFLTDIEQIARLRIDTHSYQGKATLKNLLIQPDGWAPISLATPQEFQQLAPLHQILDYGVDNNGFTVTSSGTDPNFELLITPKYIGMNFGWLTIRMAFIVLITGLLVYGAGALVKDLCFVPLLLLGAWILIIVMAGTSQRNVHPDEYVHLDATSYYRDHWLPPVIESPEIRHTYSTYGFSRLNNGEVYYLFAGKFNKLLDGLRLPDYFSLRIFNIFLFSLLLLSTIKNRYARMVAIPFLLSPQIWYIFSYCNSDAFGLFCAFVAGCLIVDPDSLLYRYLKDDGWVPKVIGVIVLSILLGLMFLLKKNYYPFIIFFYLCLGLKLLLSENFVEKREKALKQLAVITLAGLLIFGLRISADYIVNGLDRQEKIEKLQEELASPMFKASTDPHKKHLTLDQKARGVSLLDIIVQGRWFEKTFQTGFGVFGYFTITAPYIYYDLIRWTGISLLVFFFGSIFQRGGFIGTGLAISVLGLSIMLIGVSLYHSWISDFQAQGRYIFPIIPMLGILYATTHYAFNSTLLSIGVFSMYLLGIYSFIFQALMYIPKVVFQ
jgi:hypothetical protein